MPPLECDREVELDLEETIAPRVDSKNPWKKKQKNRDMIKNLDSKHIVN